MKTLVIGGYGHFGARISRALAGQVGIDLWVGGRDLRKAQAIAATMKGARGIAIDHTSSNLAEVLCALKVDLVIHTAGPFQTQSYGVALACAEAGAHYIDLADGRRFVCDFPAALHARFAAARLIAITGASTLPALSSAVVAKLTHGWQHIDSVDTVIAPGHRTGRGVATMASVLSYCGQDITIWKQGRWMAQQCWMHPVPVALVDLPARLGSLCDVPDLELLPARFAVRQRVVFRAALEIKFTQWCFAVLAWLRREGLVKKPERLAWLLNLAAGILNPWGSDAGGMAVSVAGVNAKGAHQQVEWHITARHNGPEIPCMAAILLAQRLAMGEPMPVGAYTSAGLLTLAEFEPEFARWDMATQTLQT